MIIDIGNSPFSSQMWGSLMLAPVRANVAVWLTKLYTNQIPALLHNSVHLHGAMLRFFHAMASQQLWNE